jgi:hypothetical protein
MHPAAVVAAAAIGPGHGSCLSCRLQLEKADERAAAAAGVTAKDKEKGKAAVGRMGGAFVEGLKAEVGGVHCLPRCNGRCIMAPAVGTSPALADACQSAASVRAWRQ